MRVRNAVCLTGLVVCLVMGRARAAADYPMTLALDAAAHTATSSVTSLVTIRVDRLMEESRRQRVTDALTYNGYGSFLTALRGLPAIGAIGIEKRSVEIRYAREQPEGAGRRLLLVADRPLGFLGGGDKPRAGYELTVVDLHFDAKGGATGTMSGASRVKPSPDGPVLDVFSDVSVTLSSRMPRQ